MFARYGRSASSSSSSSGSGGPITVVNQTEHSICSIDVWQNDGEPRFQTIDVSDSPVGQGGSKTIEISGTAHSLRLVECGDEYVLFDSYVPQRNREHNGISPDGRPFVLADGTADGNVLPLNRTPMSAYLFAEGSLHGEFADAALATARSFSQERRYSETFTGIVVTDSDWELNRNRNTGVMVYRWMRTKVGARWPDGHCTIQGMPMVQQHDGSDFVDSLTTQGMDSMDQHQVPCAALALLPTQ